MDKIFKRTAQGASIGGIIGAAIGSIAAAGATVALAPVSAPALCIAAFAAAATGGASSGAIGTLVGGGVGAASGTAETIHDYKVRKEGKSIVLPLFGGGCGGVHPWLIAEMMWKAYDQLRKIPQKLDWRYAEDHIFRTER